MVFTRGMLAALLAAGLSMTATGCLKKILTDGQIKSTLTGSAGAQTIQDYEVARSMAYAGLGQFEGMHYLAPDNPNALFLLTRSWAGVGFGFIEDDYEQAYEKDDEVMAEYHLARARAAHARARYYGVELLGLTADGFEEAAHQRRHDQEPGWSRISTRKTRPKPCSGSVMPGWLTSPSTATCPKWSPSSTSA